MKKTLLVILTMLVEGGVIWGISKYFEWNIMEIIFLGGLVIFGVIWLFILYTTKIHNEMNVGLKSSTGQDVGGIKLFQFRLSPVTVGVVMFMALSFCLTIFYYADYFF
ncbi:hypothetical protein WAK64_12760 [Bacillus spongiae]|uniref:DUF3899 domain-containing protein n=1 Tax=Bacillus spongiae TaxID=2683610 RepID=A0ABU8HF72_9BACI